MMVRNWLKRQVTFVLNETGDQGLLFVLSAKSKSFFNFIVFCIDEVVNRDYSYKRCHGKRLFQKNNL